MSGYFPAALWHLTHRILHKWYYSISSLKYDTQFQLLDFHVKIQVLSIKKCHIFGRHKTICYLSISGAALIAAAASSAAVAAVAASNPIGAAVVVPALGLGSTAVLGTGTTSTTFWDRFSNGFSIFQLSGITEVWPFILTVFLIYVGIILITVGNLLLTPIHGSINFAQIKYYRARPTADQSP